MADSIFLPKAPEKFPENPKPAKLEKSVKDKCLPDAFYSSTNLPTYIFSDGKWVRVKNQRMDAAVVKRPDGSFECVKIGKVHAEDSVVLEGDGIFEHDIVSVEKKGGFSFMESSVSSEKNTEMLIRQVAQQLKDVKKQGGKIVLVAGPVVVHTGGSVHIGSLIRKGYVQGLLSNNAAAVHDLETAILGTSLGICQQSGRFMRAGNKHHIQTLNQVNKAGSIAAAVETGVVKKGMMFEAVKHKIPFALAGSIRDDGPLPDVLSDMKLAQEEYAKILDGAAVVIILSTMLHGIGTGNMLPAWVATICVDINPAVVTKLNDRGSGQAVGIVTDVALFLKLLDDQL